MENAADNACWICLCEFAKICFHVSIGVEFTETLGICRKNHARSIGRFGTAAEQQPTLPLGLGCFGDLIFVTFKSNIRGNISTKHIMGEQHLGKEIMGKQL